MLFKERSKVPSVVERSGEQNTKLGTWKMNDKRNCKHPCWSVLPKATSFSTLLSTQNQVFKSENVFPWKVQPMQQVYIFNLDRNWEFAEV